MPLQFLGFSLVCGGEQIMLNPDAGVIGMMVATRTVYIPQNGTLNRYTSEELFARDENGLARRFGDVFVMGKNKYIGDQNRLRYTFMGDPAIRVPSPGHTVEISSINGVDPATAEELPVVKAQGKMDLEGTVTKANGEIDEEFTGSISLQIYDAERVITTYGNGDKGTQVSYNDRKTRLAVASVKVEKGRWKASFRLPPEIENNYSPARIVAYAWDGKGKEANGSCDRFYVYGLDTEGANDTQGPAIEWFYINSDRFEPGDAVSANSIVRIRVSDPSGINLSDAGIGHKMSLTLDNKKIFSDVDSYFTVDPDAEGPEP